MKRYGGEGCESAMGFYDELFRLAAQGIFLAFVRRNHMLLFLQIKTFIKKKKHDSRPLTLRGNTVQLCMATLSGRLNLSGGGSLCREKGGRWVTM